MRRSSKARRKKRHHALFSRLCAHAYTVADCRGEHLRNLLRNAKKPCSVKDMRQFWIDRQLAQKDCAARRQDGCAPYRACVKSLYQKVSRVTDFFGAVDLDCRHIESPFVQRLGKSSGSVPA